MEDDAGIELVVDGAEKRDAGRGIARLPESARRRLGVLSGDTLVIEGAGRTVAKMWPARPGTDEGVVRIDADTRANAGVSVGDTVRVRTVEVDDATAVSLLGPASLADVSLDRETVERYVARGLRDRPVSAGERIRIERLGGLAFTVRSTDPEGTVRVTDATDVTVVVADREDGADGRAPGGRADAGAGSGPRSGSGPGTGRESGGREIPVDVGPGGDGAAGGESDGGDEGSTGVTYEDIGGLDEELDLVREMIELPLSEPEVFAHLGIEAPKGVLLHGPPGTGKTLIARAVANEVDATFITVSGPEIMSKYKGESEEKLRETFERAREEAPSIVFFDEIDSIAGKRDDSGDVENRVVGQLLSLMDGLDGRGDVVVIGATNRVDTLDPALRRGGRFDREIEVGVPNEHGRREILEVHTRRMPLAEDVDLDALASRTHGFVGADLESLSVEAAMTALRRGRRESVALRDLTVTRADFEAAMATVEPSAMREYVAEQPTQGFEAVGGLDDAKAALERAVTWPLTYAPLFSAAGTDPPSGVLLYGPPGTGKTLLARAIAAESGVNFIHVAGPELLDRYVGESEKSVREVFERARQAAPAIVFFDEIDAIAGDRDTSSGDSGVTDRVVSQLLTEMDNAADNPNLVVLAATNRRYALDQALLRPGRLEQHVEVPAPDEAARRAIFAVHTRTKPLADEVDLDDLAARTTGFSGADIRAVCREAAVLAIREVADRYEGPAANDHADEVSVRPDHFEAALATVEPSL
jgi:transitional endoplasmic reticulum ATPase